ncbi:MAG: Gfo/Idh/MocA family oxidoreductase [Promethearchaeota archaeon]
MAGTVVRFGVIGVGGRASHLARVLMGDPLRRGDVVALCDVHEPTLRRGVEVVRRALGHDPRTYRDYRELLDDPDVDAVIVATPDHLHRRMAVAAFDAGKHVFLEKPVGINLDQVVDVLAAAKRSGKTLEVGYVLRYSPFYEVVKHMVDEGDDGDLGRPLFAQMLEQYYGGAPVFFRGWWRKRANVGGIMVQKICHDMDLFCWFFGKPERVVAFASNVEFKPGNWPSRAAHCSECENHCPYFTVAAPERRRTDECLYNTDLTGADVVDNAQVLVQFEGGLNLSMGMNFFNSRGQDDRFLRVVGSRGELTGRLSEQVLRYDPRHDASVDLSGTRLLQCAPAGLGGHGGGDEVQILEFVEALLEGREARAGVDSAYWSSVLVMGAQMSADEGRVVDVSELTRRWPAP